MNQRLAVAIEEIGAEERRSQDFGSMYKIQCMRIFFTIKIISSKEGKSF